MIDDTVTVDIGDAFSCTYSGAGNSNALGLNITMAVLGPYDKGDKVEIVYRTADGAKGYLEADYRRSRDDYYNVSLKGCACRPKADEKVLWAVYS